MLKLKNSNIWKEKELKNKMQLKNTQLTTIQKIYKRKLLCYNILSHTWMLIPKMQPMKLQNMIVHHLCM